MVIFEAERCPNWFQYIRQLYQLTAYACICHQYRLKLINPHPRLQKKLIVREYGAPPRSGVQSFFVGGFGTRIIAEYTSDKVFRGPHGPRIRGWGLISDIGKSKISNIGLERWNRYIAYRLEQITSSVQFTSWRITQSCIDTSLKTNYSLEFLLF